MCQNIRDQHELKVQAVDSNTNKTCHKNTSENHTDHAEGEAIVDGIDQREHFKEAIVYPVNKSSVEIHERDGWILDGNLKGLNDGIDKDSRRSKVLLIDLGLRAETVVAG